MQEIQDDLNIKKEETIFLGDDINDLTVLPNISLFIVPSDAHIGCKKKASYISKLKEVMVSLEKLLIIYFYQKILTLICLLKLKMINTKKFKIN